MLQELPAYTLLMPSPSDWIEAAKEIYGPKLLELERYSFTADGLSPEHLRRLLNQSRFRDMIRPIDHELARQFQGHAEHFVDLSAFESADDFVARGIGFCLPIGERIVAAAYSSLVCSRGIEISIFVESRCRQRGIATALGSKLVLSCLEQGLVPHWDAANAESCKLAKKLGYRPSGAYSAFYRED
jgi:GNAT superfamily N-acetyltransferase